ncbi:MAG: HlyC/CorC family transporter [Alphaproteobacteria bacterium]|nr:HlyC/CorC family transporter [Rickettsiales bacterium]
MSVSFYLASMCLLIFGSALCSFAETLLVGRSAEIVHNLSKGGSKYKSLLKRLMNDKDTLLAVVLLGNNICNSMAASIGVFVSINVLTKFNMSGGAVLLLNTITVTSFIFLFGEVLPKYAALSKNYKVGHSVVFFVVLLNKVLYPVVTLTDWLVKKMLRMQTSSSVDDVSPQQELKMTVEAKHLEGKIFTDYRDMLNGLLNLEEVDIGSVMKHKTDVFAINIKNISSNKTTDDLLKSGYSRFPVYEGSIDNVIGVLHIRDVFEFYHCHKSSILTRDELVKFMQKPLFVTENASLYQQMRLFRKTRNHIGIVVDEFGVFSGIITLEDIVEEIIGEIVDEHDKNDGPDILIKNDKIIVEGDYSTHDFSRRFDIDLGDNDAKTIAGLIIDKLERLPTLGETLELFGYSVIVTEMRQNKVISVEMKKIS